MTRKQNSRYIITAVSRRDWDWNVKHVCMSINANSSGTTLRAKIVWYGARPHQLQPSAKKNNKLFRNKTEAAMRASILIAY